MNNFITTEKKGKTLNETNILMDFGYIEKNKLIKNLLKKFLKNLSEKKLDEKSQDLYSNWLKLFKLPSPTNTEYIRQRRRALEQIYNTKIDENNEHQAVFSIHTTVSIITKLLIYSILSELNNQPAIDSTLFDKKSLKKIFEDIESGKTYENLGITNMCQYDFFSWYLNTEFDNEMFALLSSLKNKVNKYKYIETNIDKIKDTIQALYENLVPKEIRHSFGETYTPQIHADIILNKSKEFLKDKISYKAIDPTCGSGVFLLSVIKDKINSNRIEQIFDEVVGIDLNPIATIMAKFNYILATYPYLIKKGKMPSNLEIPIYLGNSLDIPNIEKINNFDLIIGNPPWIRWSILPLEYRNKIKKSLRDEGLFSKDTNYGGIDLNTSALIAHNVIKNLLNEKGVLSFIFPYGVLMNKSYDGFRNLKFGNKIMEIKMIIQFTKPIFKEEESVVLILQNSEIIEEKQKQLNLI